MIIYTYLRFPLMQGIFLTLERVFALHEMPHKIRTNNGPPFDNQDFESLKKSFGVEHKPVTTKWP